MDLGALFFVLAVALLVAVFISRPFFSAGAKKPLTEGLSDAQQTERKRSELLAEHDRVLTALRDLEFDHTLGKIPEEDYPEQRAALMASGADALRQLDELGSVQQAASVEDRLEAAIAARRADAAVKNAPPRPLIRPENDEVEALVAARRKTRQEKAGGFCPGCGKPVHKGDQFCSHCGTLLS